MLPPAELPTPRPDLEELPSDLTPGGRLLIAVYVVLCVLLLLVVGVSG